MIMVVLLIKDAPLVCHDLALLLQRQSSVSAASVPLCARRQGWQRNQLWTHIAAPHMDPTPGQEALASSSACNRNEEGCTLLRPVKLNMPTWLSTKDQSLSPFSFVRCLFRSLRTCCNTCTRLSASWQRQIEKRCSVCVLGSC